MSRLRLAKRNCRLRQARRAEDLRIARCVVRRLKRLNRTTNRHSPARYSVGNKKNIWVHHFICPASLNLSTAYEETVNFLMQFRNWGTVRRKARFHLDMTSIRSITPAGALVLAAELDRWSALHGVKLRARDLDDWDPGVRSLLSQMGFFALLERPSGKHYSLSPSNIEFLPFHTGDNCDGRPFLSLRDQLERLIGKLKFRLRLFQAVSEAITNVKHHAYKKTAATSFLRRWWISASVDKAAGEVTVMTLDHGFGIPKTLPATFKEWARTVGSAIVGGSSDASMIEAAIELGRSSVKAGNRGHGLYRDVRSFVENHDKPCSLRIVSARGCYEFKRAADGTLATSLTNHNVPFSGTFIEWKFGI